MNKHKIFGFKNVYLLNIHNNGQNHRLAMGFAVEEFGQVVLYAAFELDAVNSLATVKNAHDRFISDGTHLVHQLLGFTNVNKAAGDDVRPGEQQMLFGIYGTQRP